MTDRKKNSSKSGQKCRVWWVNHGRTFSKAREGGYLWAPMPVKGGNTFAHWESMTYVSTGDLILNFAGGKIAALGIARGGAEKYTEEAKTKNMVGKAGWRVNLDFYDLRKPIDFEDLKPFIVGINRSIAENKPFNDFNAVNNGYLFNFSVAGMNLIAEKFTDRIPDAALTYLEKIRESDFLMYLRKKGLIYEPEIVKRYILSLHARSLVVLSGNSGVGKTGLALNYARYLNESNQQTTKVVKDATLFKHRWFKLSYNDKNVINAFEGSERKIDQVRSTMLSDGLIPLGWDNRDLNQKKIIKDLKIGDVVVAYQGAYIIGGVGVVTHPHFMDETGDAFDAFCESSKNFIRVDWLFSGPLKIKDFSFKEYDIPGFGMWVDTIHEMTKDQAVQFTDYLENKSIRLTTKKIEPPLKNYQLVPVGADWKSRADLLGYLNNTSGKYEKTKSLELILNAKKRLDKGRSAPFFLILDEMNLVNADHYLLDLLTGLESGEPVILHDSISVEQDTNVPKELLIPSNLFIIGTTGADFYLLSEKVRDTANIIEFQTMPIQTYLSKIKQPSFNKDLHFPQTSEINYMTVAEILEKMADVETGGAVNSLVNEKIVNELGMFQSIFIFFGVSVGFRAVNEILRYLCIAWHMDHQPEKWPGWAEAMDSQIQQRLLPKINRDDKNSLNYLKCLYCCCFSGKTEEQVKMLEKGESVAELLDQDWRGARYKGTAGRLSFLQKQLERSGEV